MGCSLDCYLRSPESRFRLIEQWLPRPAAAEEGPEGGPSVSNVPRVDGGGGSEMAEETDAGEERRERAFRTRVRISVFSFLKF